MATKRKPKKREEEHEHLSICITAYEARAGNSINSAAYSPETGYFGENDPVRVYDNELIIEGVCNWPEELEGRVYEFTFYGEDLPSGRKQGTLKDIQIRNEFGVPQWRTYRGYEIPIYDPPSGLGTVEKVRGKDIWSSACWVDPRFVDTALTILASKQTVYMQVHEVKIERHRWIRSVSFQTIDPAEE